jgi:hypothetical protein
MSTSPIDRMILGAVKCVRCGAGYGECGCWSTRITLRCPKCSRTKKADPEPSDPPGTAIVEATCDRCDDGGGFPEVHYYDAKGGWFNGERFVAAPREG